MGLSGNILGALISLYANVQCCVKVGMNGHLTDWFKVNSGLRQGCLVSPLLFNLHINDLAISIKERCRGIKFDDQNRVCLLMYADDIALIAEDEEDLQNMLNVLYRWCNIWDVNENPTKSQIEHFRNGSKVQTDHEFRLWGHYNLEG